MSIKQFAAMLNGREYMDETTKDEMQQAEDLGYVVVLGEGDDRILLLGAIYGDSDCCNGGTVYLSKKGQFRNRCSDRYCPYAERERKKCATIEAVWCDPDSDACWSYKTDIPHETFNIYEDGKLYCVGIVFDIASLDA